MKKLGKMLRKSIVFCFVMFVICAFIYPFALTGISQLTMKNKANGNLIDKNGEPISNAEEAVGSELIGQDFAEDYFFHGRVSAVNYNTYTEEQKENGEYSGVASGGSNYGNSNPELEKRMEKDLETFLKEHPDVKKEDIPADLLTASGSGLDPHISPASAKIQVPIVAANTGFEEEELYQMVEAHTEHKALGIFGEERVNVLKLNLDLARKLGVTA